MSNARINVKKWRDDDGYYLSERDLFDVKGDVNALPMLIEKGYVSDISVAMSERMSGYKLTEKGNRYFIWDEPICIGERTVTEILEYTVPAEEGGATFSNVKYAYSVDLNELGFDLDIDQKLLDNMIYGRLKGEGITNFVKTNKGWRLSLGKW